MKNITKFAVILLVVFVLIFGGGSVSASKDVSQNEIVSTDLLNHSVINPEEFSQDNILKSQDLSDMESSPDSNIQSENQYVWENIYFDASASEDGNGSAESPYNHLKYDRLKPNSNLFLKNGNYSMYGGSIYYNISFYGENPDKTIIDLQDGIVHVNGPTSIENLTFVRASWYVYNNLTAVNSVFDGNCPGQSSIVTLGFDEHVVKFDNCSFINAFNDYYGAAINLFDCREVIISNCTFKDNRAKNGGAIYLKLSNLNVSSTVFSSNHANFSAGAIFVDGSDLSVYDCTFVNNSADCGGAIYSEGSIYSYKKDSTVIIDDSLFMNNHAFEGASILSLESLAFYLNNCDFINSSSVIGGTASFLSTRSNISCCNFENNHADDGSTVYQICGDLNLTNSRFVNNTADNGDVFILKLDNACIANNSFMGNGVCVIVSDDENLNFNNNTFADEKAFLNFTPNLFIGNGNYTLLKTNDTFNGTIPSKYDPRDYGLITSAKNQDQRGYCWAFGIIATLESCILKATGVKYEFSELNVANLNAIHSYYGFRTGDGASANCALAYLLNWFGPVDENDDEYSSHKPLSQILNGLFHVHNVIYLHRDNISDLNTFKEAILKYGAVGTSVFFTGDTFNGYTSYDPDHDLSNHEIAIVGWDDSYSRQNFKTTPPGDGAWIVKNSWGEADGNGCYYVSYYDATLADSYAFTFAFNDSIRLDKNYQYDFSDFLPYVFSNSSVWYKNVYNSTDDEYLAAVSTYFHEYCDWELQIYVNGEFVHNQSGKMQQGFYTINLDKFIPLRKNDTFEVVFRQSTLEGYFAHYPVMKYPFDDYIGKSFISQDNEHWTELSDYEQRPMVNCIKAYTFLNKIKTEIALDMDYTEYGMVNLTASVLDEYGNKITNGNVTFNLAGEKYVVCISNGIANILHNFNKGMNLIGATFDGEGYVSSSLNRSINISKIDIEVNIDIQTHLNTAIINVSTSPEVIGNGIIIIGGKNYTINLTKGKGSLKLNDLENKSYTLHFELENKTYECDAVKNFNLTFSKTRIIAENFTAYQGDGDEYVIKLINETSDGAGKTIQIRISDQNFTLTTDSAGEAYFNINLTAGNYLVWIGFEGEGIYLPTEKTAIISVIKRNSTLNISDFEFDFGTSGSIHTEFGGALGINARVLNHSEAIISINATLIVLSGLNAGNYTLMVSTVGDDNHNSVNRSVAVIVNKVDSVVDVGDVELDYGSFKDVEVITEGAIGITAKIEGENVDVNGFIVPISGLDAGNYALDVTTVPDDNHVAVTKSVSITVNRVDSVVDVGDVELNYGSSKDVSVLTDGAIGFIAKIDGVYAPVDGDTIHISGLNPGNHTLIVTTVPDVNHNAVSKSVSVSVNAFLSTLSVEDIVFDYGDVGSCVVSFTGASGILVDGLSENPMLLVSVEDGVIFVSGLDAGNYTLNVTTVPDNDHVAVTKSVSVIVNRIDSEVHVGDVEMEYGSSKDVYVQSEGAVAITAKIDDNDADVNDFTVSIPALSPGNHTLSVTAVPDSNHNPVTRTASIRISKPNPELEIEVIANENIQNSFTISITNNTDVNVTINGKSYGIKNGKVDIDTANLPAGTYEVVASIAETGVFHSMNATASFEIMKMASNIVITCGEAIEASPLAVEVHIDGATGSVSVNGQTAALTNGNASFVLNNLVSGNLTIRADYSGDEKYSSASSSIIVDVKAKRNPELTVSVEDIKAGENAVVIIKINPDATGNLTVDGSEISISEGRATLTIPNLAIGNYSIVVKFSGDRYFNGDEKTASFKVIANQTNNTNSSSGNASGQNTTIVKADCELHVDVEDVNVGESVVLNVKINGNATGKVSVIFEGNENVLDVSMGKATFEISGLTEGDYSALVRYEGDEHFNADEKTVSFRVISLQNKTNETVTPEISIPSKFNQSIEDSFTVSLPDDATGTVTLTVNGTDYVADVINGSANVKLPNLANGIYNLTVIYSGDGKYSKVTSSTLICINSTSTDSLPVPDIRIPPLDTPSSDGSVTIELPSDATGKVTLSINGKDFEYPVENGIAKIIIPDLEDGKYQYTITYSGDGRYSSFSNNGTLNKASSKVDPVIEASNAKVTYSAGQYYTIKVNGTDGKPDDGAQIVITVNGKPFKTLTATDGIARFKVTNVPGTYRMNITSLGKSLTRTLTVKHLVTLKSVTVKKSAKKLVLTATLGKINNKYLKNKKITFKFNGKKYAAKTDKKGVAKVTVKAAVLNKLKVGKKVTYQATYSKDTVKKTVKIKK